MAQCSAKSNKTSFIHNRVTRIRELCKDFEIRHVGSKDNPADFTTKPIRAKKLKSNELWEKGPEWLTDMSNWKKEEQKYTLFPNTLEEESQWKVTTSLVQVRVANFLGQITGTLPNNKSLDIWRNEYAKTVRFVAMIDRWRKRSKKLGHEITLTKVISSNEFAEAERKVIRRMQLESFPEEIASLKKGKIVKKNNLCQMKLYLDKHDIIRCQGRLNDTGFISINTPILFAPDHPLTIMYIQYKHKCYNCCSVNYTVNMIRRDIHTAKLRQQIKKVLNNCVICKKLVGRPYRYPENPPLDVYRTRCSEPFSNCGCDYIGPFTVVNDLKDAEKEIKRTETYKIWIVLFTCLVTRAIFLTIVPDRSTETFLNALRELSARYTEPKMMISDNEGAFRKGNSILQKIALTSDMRKNNIIWKFLPSRAPWMGAVWERLVGMVKLELMKMQMRVKWNEYEWRAHLTEIESVINERPLTYVSDEGEEPEVITPKSILGGTLSSSTIGIDINIDEMLLDMGEYKGKTIELHKEKIKIKSRFWKNLRNDYLSTLRSARYKPDSGKKTFCNRDPKVGDVVIIHNVDPRLKWRMGIITQLVPSTDGCIRTAMVKTTKPSKIKTEKNLKVEVRRKAINHLYPLELNIEDGELDKVNVDFDDSVDNICETDIGNTSQVSQQLHGTSVSVNETVEELEENEWLSCGMVTCKRPTKNNLKWVYCEACKEWIHAVCVNLDETIEMEDNYFACPPCWRPIQPLPEEDNNSDSESESDNEKDSLKKFDFCGFENLNPINGRRTRKAAEKCRNDLIKKIKNKQL